MAGDSLPKESPYVSGVVHFFGWICRSLFALFYHLFGDRQTVPKIGPLDADILFKSATTLASEIRCGKLTSRKAVDAYIARINAVNPILNAVCGTRFDSARQRADEVDMSLAKGMAPSVMDAPYLGVPCTIKECIEFEGMPWSAGMPSRRGVVGRRNAITIRRLLDAGAIPLATTNTSEMCASFECNNTIYGRTRNPYDTRRTPGGSSGGEAALLGAGASPFGLGSDGGGSIRMPANFCGIYGHKPTQGAVPSHEQCIMMDDAQADLHTFGPMCRYSADLRPLTRILMDPGYGDVCQIDKKVAVKNMKIYYVDLINSILVTPIHQELKQAMYKVVNRLESEYDIPCIRLNPHLTRLAFWMWINDMGHEDTHPVTYYFCDGKGTFNPYAEFVRWIMGKSDHTGHAIEFALFERWSKLGEVFGFITPSKRAAVRSKLRALQREMDDLLGDGTQDAILLFPSHPTLAPFHNQSLFHPANLAYTSLFNSLGYPVTQVPVQLSKSGVPIGLQIVAGKKKDYLTISAAEEFEALFGGWKEP